MANYVGRRGYVGNAIYGAFAELGAFIAILVIRSEIHLMPPQSTYALIIAIGALIGFIGCVIQTFSFAYFGNRTHHSRIRNSYNYGYAANPELDRILTIIFWILMAISFVMEIVFGMIFLISMA